MEPETLSPRDAELRRALVSTTNLTKYSRLRISPKLIAASVGVFALAGALTGGAVAAAATISSSQVSQIAAARVAGTLLAKQQDGTLVGSPVTDIGAGQVRLDLGAAPRGATMVAAGYGCIAPGQYTEKIDGKVVGEGSCSLLTDPGAELDAMKDAGHHVITITSENVHQELVAWASWVVVPTIRPSAAQQAEAADGVVTRDEYLAAFNRYAGCLAAAGYPLGNVDETGTLVNTSIPEAAVDSGVDNRCYVSEWKQVDTMWQLQNWSTSASVVMMRECLTGEGITPAATEDAIWAQVLANPAAKKCMGVE